MIGLFKWKILFFFILINHCSDFYSKKLDKFYHPSFVKIIPPNNPNVEDTFPLINKKLTQKNFFINTLSANKHYINHIFFHIFYFIALISFFFSKYINDDFHEVMIYQNIIGLTMMNMIIQSAIFVYWKILKKSSYEENQIYLKNKSFYWSVNKSYKNYNSTQWFWKKYFIKINYMCILICTIGFSFLIYYYEKQIQNLEENQEISESKEKRKTKKENFISMFFFGLLYIVLDYLTYYFFYYYLELDLVYINDIASEETYIIHNKNILLMRYKPKLLNYKQEIEWNKKNKQLLDKIRNCSVEEDKFSVLNDEWDENFLLNTKIHDKVYVWINDNIE